MPHQEPQPMTIDLADWDEMAELVRLLRRVSSTLDQLWGEAVSNHSVLAVRLGEASHGVHRALIALRDEPSRPPATFGPVPTS